MNKTLARLICLALAVLALAACNKAEKAAPQSAAPSPAPSQSTAPMPTPTPSPLPTPKPTPSTSPTPTPTPTTPPTPKYSPQPKPELMSYEEYFSEERILPVEKLYDSRDFSSKASPWVWGYSTANEKTEDTFVLYLYSYMRQFPSMPSTRIDVTSFHALPFIYPQSNVTDATRTALWFADDVAYFVNNGTEIYSVDIFDLTPELLCVADDRVNMISGDVNVAFFVDASFNVYRLHRPTKTLEFVYQMDTGTNLLDFTAYSNYAFFWREPDLSDYEPGIEQTGNDYYDHYFDTRDGKAKEFPKQIYNEHNWRWYV